MNRMRLQFLLASLVVVVLACSNGHAFQAPAGVFDGLTYSRNVAGESKSLVLEADRVAMWSLGDETCLMLDGQVLSKLGFVNMRAGRAVAWANVARYRQTGVWVVDIYAEDLALDTGAESKSAPRGLLTLSTRGELRFQASKSKVDRQDFSGEPLFLRAAIARSQVKGGTARPVAAGVAPAVIEPASAQLPAVQPFVPSPPPPPPVPESPPQPSPPPMAAVVPLPAVVPPVSVSGADSQLQPPMPLPASPDQPFFEGVAPVRQFSIAPRTNAGFEFNFGPQVGEEQALIVTGGVIMNFRNVEGASLIDIEADRVVIWTKGATAAQVLENLRGKGGASRDMEVYLSGNVEMRSVEAPGPRGVQGQTRTIRADEVYYDLRRNTAVAMKAEMQFYEPRVPDPIFIRAAELQKLSENQYRVIKAEISASQTPADPGLKLYIAEATVEEKRKKRTGLFGNEIADRQTGDVLEYTESLTRGRNAFIKIWDVPVFYLPYLQGDARDPLGPIEAINAGFSNIFGGQFGLTLNTWDMLGLQPLDNTKWRFDLDYLSKRGPGLGTDYSYLAKDIFNVPGTTSGGLRVWGINDTGTDVLGGGRGANDDHPEYRGRASWRQFTETPFGFSLQANMQLLSDQNFLEQYFKNEFDTDPVQTTHIYARQNLGYNVAAGLIGQVNVRDWATDTQWLPKADFWVTGQTFFDVITYSSQVGAGYGQLQLSNVPEPYVSPTDVASSAGRFHWMQEAAVPFSMGALRVVPYIKGDLAYYTADINPDNGGMGRAWGGPGVRASIPFSALFPEAQNDLFNINGLNHKAVFGVNYLYAGSTAPYTNFAQFDRLNDDATDQALRDIRVKLPIYNPAYGTILATSPLYDPTTYAIRRTLDNRYDTLDAVQVFQLDLMQRLQTKRGFPGSQHVVDWMVLDLSASAFPEQSQNFGSSWAFLQYDFLWNIGDRTSLVSSGWLDPIDNGAQVVGVGAYFNRSDRTSLFLGYRQIEPVGSKPITAGVTYTFSPKYAISAFTSYDVGTQLALANSLIFSRTGKDAQINLGFTYNAMQNNFGFTFEVLPRVVASMLKRTSAVSSTSLMGAR